MIIVRFSGGLGNQMFQQAMSQVLQEKYPDVMVKADCEHYRLYRVHNGFEIDKCFEIEVNFASPQEIRKVSDRFACGIPLKSFPPAICNYIERQYRSRVKCATNMIKQTYFNAFDEGVFESLDIDKDYYVEGEWQNWKYFKGYEESIQRKFRFKSKLTHEQDRLWEQQMASTDSVSIHLRRGDFVNSTSHDLCGDDYYKKAIACIKERVENPLFFVFSDDIEYAKKQFQDIEAVFVEHSKFDAQLDMQLMSKCKHNIIPNSSFSFWAAFLNQNPDKIVICPQYFFRKQDIWYDFEAPDEWIRINNRE